MFTGCGRRCASLRRKAGAGILLAALVGLVGCSGVRETAKFYLPYAETPLPPRQKDAPIPILGRTPERPHKMIGRLGFATDRDWGFIRSSIEYNGRAQGADFAVIREVQSQRRQGWAQSPPSTDWIPVPGPVVQDKKGEVISYGVQWVPVYRPGYFYPATIVVTSFVAELGIYKGARSGVAL